MDIYCRFFNALLQADVRFVLIGVGGANYYLLPHQNVFLTDDRDLLLPLDPANTLACWQVAEVVGLKLWTATEPLGAPLDLWLAERVVERRAAISAIAEADAKIDLTYIMAGFAFDEVWKARRHFEIEGIKVPVASLEQIVESKRNAARKKDLLFLTTHEETLRSLLGDSDEDK